MIKLCTIDLDGTLFDKEKNISLANKEAIKEAQKNGCKIVIASGRPIHGVVPVLEKLDLFKSDDYVICYNGAKVFNTKLGDTVYASTISGKTVKELYKESKRLKLNFHAFRKNEELITDVANPYTDVEVRINNIEFKIVDFNQIDDDEEFLKCMIVGEDSGITKAMQELNPRYYEEYCVVRSSSIFLEFLNKQTNKGSALKALAKHLKLDMSETMAIGDAGNELEMIKQAGIGVAMGNAFPEVKEYANFITATNEESGVAVAINKFVNNK